MVKDYPFITMLRMFELEMILTKRLGRDCAGLVMRFLEPPVAPYDPYSHVSDPWSFSTEVDACSMIDLPLFAP